MSGQKESKLTQQTVSIKGSSVEWEIQWSFRFKHVGLHLYFKLTCFFHVYCSYIILGCEVVQVCMNTSNAMWSDIVWLYDARNRVTQSTLPWHHLIIHYQPPYNPSLIGRCSFPVGSLEQVLFSLYEWNVVKAYEAQLFMKRTHRRAAWIIDEGLSSLLIFAGVTGLNNFPTPAWNVAETALMHRFSHRDGF